MLSPTVKPYARDRQQNLKSDGRHESRNWLLWMVRASFNFWRNGNSVKAHTEKKDENSGKSAKPLWTRPPVPIFYEGTLVISGVDGA